MEVRQLVNKIHLGDCRQLLSEIPAESVHLCLSDIPYGIGLDQWDILHDNKNSAYLGRSPAQIGKNGFKRRGKPIRGWSKADRQIVTEYESWCQEWADELYPVMKKGAPVIIFGARRTIHRAIIALEKTGFILRDMLAWKKTTAHHRSQSLSKVLERRGNGFEAATWQGWRLGNLAPIFEPIAWLFKPYDRTITDNVLDHQLGAMNVAACSEEGKSPTNLLEFGFERGEQRLHEAQKPVALMTFLIKLTTRPGQIVLDPFIGSGTTAVACRQLDRRVIGFEKNAHYHEIACQRFAEVNGGFNHD